MVDKPTMTVKEMFDHIEEMIESAKDRSPHDVVARSAMEQASTWACAMQICERLDTMIDGLAAIQEVLVQGGDAYEK